MRQGIHNHRAFGGGQQYVSQANQRPRRQHIGHAGSAAGGGFLRFHFSVACAQFLADCADEFAANLDLQFFNWLFFDAVIGDGHHLRATDFELKAFAPHGLDQNAQVQLAAARHRKADTVFFDAQCYVGFQFSPQSVANLPRGGKFTLASFHRAGIWAKIHAQCRRFNGDRRQGLRLFFISNRIANVRFAHADQRHNVASKRLVKLFAVQPAVTKNFLNSR